MKVKQVIVTALVLWLLVVYAVATHAQPPPSIPIGPGLTEDKPQSKLWYTDNADRTVTWWGILGFVGDANAAPGVYFYKLENGVLVRQTFPDALVDENIEARADVLWNDHDLHLFVLMYKGADTTLHKYSYDASTQTYTLLAGFPVAIPLLAGSESATITQDSTGRLWIAYDPAISPALPKVCPPDVDDPEDPDAEVHALWSVDHTTWDVMNNRVVLQSPICNDDLAAIVAVSFKDRIGVMWSDQTGTGAEARDNFGFRFHWDANPDPTSWSPVEIVPLPPRTLIADDHIHLTVTEHGDIIAATKSSTVATDANGNPILNEEGEPIALNEINLFVRWHDGKPANPWAGPYFVTSNASRPIVLFDKVSKDVYVFYTGAFDFPVPEHRNISYKVAKLSKLADLAVNPEHVLIEVPFPDPPGSCDPNELNPLSPAFCPQYSVNNATSTKQAVDVSKGLLVVAKDEREDEEHAPELSRAYYNLLTTENLRKGRKEAKSSGQTYSSRR
jgi:hypothetical protein